MYTIGVLGPSGSHSEEALTNLIEAKLDLFRNDVCAAGLLTQTEPSLQQLIAALAENKYAAIFVPVENTLEGSVREVLDALAFGFEQPTIQLEWPHLVKHCLIRKIDSLEGIESVTSHPQALAQSREGIITLLGDTVQILPAPSTSFAVQSLLDLPDNVVAIGTRQAALNSGLKVIADDICHHAENITRFLLLSFNHQLVNPSWVKSNISKTSLCVGLHQNASGALLSILEVISAYKLNMTKIESRPAKTRLGEYVFYIDFEGEPPFGFYENLEAVSGFVKRLGTYPAAALTVNGIEQAPILNGL